MKLWLVVLLGSLMFALGRVGIFLFSLSTTIFYLWYMKGRKAKVVSNLGDLND